LCARMCEYAQFGHKGTTKKAHMQATTYKKQIYTI
jgi:hypothetical protein